MVDGQQFLELQQARFLKPEQVMVDDPSEDRLAAVPADLVGAVILRKAFAQPRGHAARQV